MKIRHVSLLAAVVFSALAPLTANAAPIELAAAVSPEQQQAYIATAGPLAQQIKAQYDIPASVLAGQAALESKYGTSGLTVEAKNHLGMKCVSPTNPGPIAIGCTPRQTQECDPLPCHIVTAYFRTYASMHDSFRDYGRLMTTSPNYTPALPFRHNPDEYIRRIATKYATDPVYADKVIDIMRKFDLYKLDTTDPQPPVDPNPPGPAYHQVRKTDGSWTGFAPIGIDSRDVAMATLPDGTAQVVAIGKDDVVYHRVRNADGTWTAFAPLWGFGEHAKAQKVSIAGGHDSSSQIVIATADGTVYHNLRKKDGSWTQFAPLEAGAKDVAITVMPDLSAQVVIAALDDVIHHRVRNADGTWTPFAPLWGFGQNAKAQKVSIAGGHDSSSQIVIATADGTVYHNVRKPDGTWTPFAPLSKTAKDVAITVLPDGSSQVVVAGGDDVVYHRVRADNGTWTEFAPLWGFGQNAKAKKVTVAGGHDGSAHVLITGV
jgi:hypothetical protein